VIAVIPRISDAVTRVTGQVALPLATSATTVSLQLNGQPVRSTPPDSTGRFVLYPVPVGVYDLVIMAPGWVVATITGVPVTSTSSTTVNLMSAPIDPPASLMHSGLGRRFDERETDRRGGQRHQAVCRRLGRHGRRGPVNGTTGAFSYAHPASAPVRAAFAASAAAIALTADTGTPTGKYTLVGVAGAATQTLDFDISSADVGLPLGSDLVQKWPPKSERQQAASLRSDTRSLRSHLGFGFPVSSGRRN